MEITVFGATGGTGGQVVRQALAAGIGVTAVARDPSRIDTGGAPAPQVVGADLSDPTALVAAIDGRDAVISALGNRGRGPSTVHTVGIRAIIEAMRTCGTHRLLIVSNSGMFTDGDDTFVVRAIAKPILQRVLREVYRDAAEAERVVIASGLNWTIVRPPRLTNGRRTGVYRTRRDRNIRGGTRISRADLADLLLRSLGDPTTHQTAITVGY